jgi:Mrp family chromosome partitioning ATPase
MSRMLEALKRIEAKQSRQRPAKKKKLPQDNRTLSDSATPSVTPESASPSYTMASCAIQSPPPIPSVSDISTDLPSSPIHIQEPICRPDNAETVIPDSLTIEKTLAQVESAMASALSTEEPDVYDEMAQYIMAQITPGQSATLLFTSPTDGAGKTETLFSLSKTLIKHIHEEVLVVDANFYHPDFTRLLGNAFSFALEDILSNPGIWQNAVLPTSLARLSMLPNKGGWQSREKTFNARDWGRLLEQFKTRYKLVLIDASSLAYAQTASIVTQCDGVYLVVRLGYTTPSAVSDAVGVIEQVGGRLLGSIAVGEQLGNDEF